LRLTTPVVFLPPALDIVPQLLVFLGDEEKNGELLAELIRVDPGLTANVLRVANSAAFAGAYRMENLSAAVLRLGLREVYRIVLQVVASPVFLNATQPGASSLDLWQHSLQSAVAAQVLARWLGEDSELAFTAGLLHDVGKLIFHQLFGKDYIVMVHDAQAQNALLYQREFARYQTDHAAVGGRLLKRWNFPDTMIHTVQFHHELAKCPKPDVRLVSLIFASNLLAHKIAEPSPFPPHLLAGSPAVLKNLGLGSIDDLWVYAAEAKQAFDREHARLVSR